MKKNIFLEIVKNIKGRALDAGSGDGWMGRYVQTINKNLEIIGIDMNAKEEGDVGFKTYNINLLDIEKEKKTLGKFNLIYSFHVLEHIEEGRVQEIAKIFYELLENEGVVIIEVPHPITKYVPSFFGFYFWTDPTHIRTYSANELEDIFSQYGLETIYKGFDQTAFVEFEKTNDRLNFLKRLLYKIGIMRSTGIYIGKKK